MADKIDCLFCKIVNGEIPSEKLYEDDELLAFKDISPQAPVHFLIIPKKHIASLMDLDTEDSDLIGRLMYRAQETAKQQGIKESEGGRFIINCKKHGGQTVDHLHVHFLGGRQLSLPLG